MFRIETIEVTAFQQNCRVLIDDESKNAVVIDPGGEALKIVSYLKESGLELKAIWLTHSHLDHCGGVAELLESNRVSLLGHPVEQEMRAHVLDICAMYGMPTDDMRNCPEPDKYIEGGETLTFADCEFEVLFTPGHSPGHVCFFHRDSGTLLAGDTLFAGSIGRTDLPGGSGAVLMKSIREVLLELPDETKVLPGHGPETTIGVERNSNPFITGAQHV